jgi:cytochrome c556
MLGWWPRRVVETTGIVVEGIMTKESSMKSLVCGACAAGLLLAVVAMGFAGRVSAAAEETPTIGEIMEKLHKGRKSPMATLKAALKSQSPDWASVQKEAKTYAKYAASMPKNKPPKGDGASYQTLAKAYAAGAKALEGAAVKEDLGGTKTALGKIGGSCMGCHDAHKED